MRNPAGRAENLLRGDRYTNSIKLCIEDANGWAHPPVRINNSGKDRSVSGQRAKQSPTEERLHRLKPTQRIDRVGEIDNSQVLFSEYEIERQIRLRNNERPVLWGRTERASGNRVEPVADRAHCDQES